MDYWQTISKFRDRYPHIRFLESASKKHWNKSKAVVTILEFFSDHIESKSDLDASALSDYLNQIANNPCKHRLYLIEDLDHETINLIGGHFKVDPYVFACQVWTSYWSNFPTFVGTPRKLLSSVRSTVTYDTETSERTNHQVDGKDPLPFTLRYLEINVLKTGSPPFPMYSNDNLGREMHRDKLDPEDASFYLRRNATFWNITSSAGWDAFILSEPPLSFADPTYSSHPYQHGYCDFSPWPTNAFREHDTHEVSGPGRHSLRKDLEFYWTNRASHLEILQAIEDPQNCSYFLKKVVASQWNVALEFLWRKVSHCQMGTWGYEERWSEDRRLYKALRDKIAMTNEWRRRVAWIIEWYCCSLETLGIRRDDRHDNTSAENLDLINALQRLLYCKQELENILVAITGISQTLQGTVSVDEATLSRRLAHLGLVFIPMAFASSIFSMGGEFQPGGNMFWVYFAVAIPLTVLTLLGWWVVKEYVDRANVHLF